MNKPAKNFREFERENDDVKKGEHLKLPLSRIQKKPGFNPRDLSKPATVQKILEMSQSYEAGQFVPLIVVRMAEDGEHVNIVDGECRYTAAVMADERMRAAGGKGIEFLEVVRFSGTEKEAKVATFLAAEGESLLPLEQSDLVLYLQKEEGLNREQIAAEFHKSIGWIDRLIVISKLPDEVKALVREEKVAAEVAVKFVKDFGKGAVAKINEAWEKATKGGEHKVTPKHKDAVSGDEGGEGGEGAGGAAAAPKKDAAAEKAEKKRVAKQYEVAQSLAFSLPDKIKKPRNMADDEEYDVKLSGAAIKLLIALQDKFTPEIEAALAAEKETAPE